MPDIKDTTLDERIRRLAARYGWPLPPMAGAEEPADGGTGTNTAGDDSTGGGGAREGGGAPGTSGNADHDTERGQEPASGVDAFDPRRAMDTIRKQRESEMALKKENKDLRERIKRYEDASKSEAERLTERASTAEREAAAAKAEAARLRVALRKGLTEAQAKRLVGETEEELEADADELLESFGTRRADRDDSSTSRRPRERLRPGSVPDSDPEPTDPAALAKQVRAGW